MFNVSTVGIEVEIGNVYIMYSFTNNEYIITLDGKLNEVTYRSSTGRVWIDQKYQSDCRENVEVVNFDKKAS